MFHLIIIIMVRYLKKLILSNFSITNFIQFFFDSLIINLIFLNSIFQLLI